jgi:hypothetical protein
MSNLLVTCPCCGYRSISEEFEICEVCGWEYNFFQEKHVDDAGGPNRVSLRVAQENFQRCGSAKPGIYPSFENPSIEFEYDPNWRSIGGNT